MSLKPTLRRGAVLSGVVALLLIAWIGSRGWLARQHLNDARAELLQAKTALLDQRTEAADAALAGARRDTESARRLTGDPIWRAAAAIPLVGNSMQTSAAVALAADDTAHDVLPGVVSAYRAVDSQRLRRPDGSFDVERLSRAQPGLEQAASQAERVRQRAATAPTRALLPPVAAANTELQALLGDVATGLRSAAAAVRLAPALLGVDRPRRYFVMVQQTSETRGTGGITAGYAVLEAARGRIRITRQGTNADLKPGPVPVPRGVPRDFVERYAPDAGFAIWQNVNLSPDLPVVARVVAARWKAQGGAEVDAVIAVDSTALAALLRGSDPIDVGERVIPVEQLVDYLAIGQYADFAVDETDERKQQLAGVAATAARRLTTGGGDTGQLLAGLVEAVGSGHLHMAGIEPELASSLREVGADQALPAGPAPVAYPVVFNSTGGKLDYFLERRLTYAGGACKGTRRRTSISVALTNRAPASGLPPYVTLYFAEGGQRSSTDNHVNLSVFATRGSRLISATLDGKAVSTTFRPDGPYLVAQQEAGLPVWTLMLPLPREEQRQLVLHLDEPVTAGAPRAPEQPLARPMSKDVTLPVCR